jgi:capsular exopolysaccharide synthesis family protein
MSRVNEAMRRSLGTAAEDDLLVLPRGPVGATLDGFGAETVRQDEPEVQTLPRSPVPLFVPPPAGPPAPAHPDTDADFLRPSPPAAGFLASSPAARNRKLVVSPHMPPASILQYRRLAAALHDLQLERGLKIILISSAVPQEGKTLTITNLALTLSESYHRRTLLIDADLRCPSVHELFGVSKTPGLGDVLGTSGRQLPLLQASSWLHVLTAGHPGSTPLAQLTSERLRDIVNDAAAHFDWVLLDTPPVSLLPDAQHLASVSDGVLLVIAAGRTPYKMIQRAVASIGPERIVGTMLNYADDGILLQEAAYGRYYP